MPRFLDVQHAPDHNGMGVPLDDFLDLAIDRRQRADQKRNAGDSRRPLRTREPIRAFQAAFAGKPFGDIELAGGEDIDSENNLIRFISPLL